MRPALVALLLLPGCVIARQRVALPGGTDARVLLLSGPLGEPLTRVARHAWLAVRREGAAEWERFEVLGPGGEWGHVHRSHGDPLGWFGQELAAIRLHGQWRGRRAAAAIACLERESPRYPFRHRYLIWPGPNSNTYVDLMLRRCGLRADLPSTCVGKDWRGSVGVGVSFTEGGTGVQLETPLVGLKIGLTEGIELHLFTLAIGVDLWPPAIVLPVGDGRIGFDDR